MTLTHLLIIKIKNWPNISVIIPWSDHCAALPGFHACAGSDYTASFSRKGKVRPLALLEKNKNVIEMFSKLGDEEVINDEQCADAEKLVCSMYGQKNYPPLPKLVKYKPKIGKNPISCARRVDGSSLPPCSPVILQKLRRTNYVCSVWLNAHKPSPPTF